MPGMKKLDKDLLLRELSKGMALPGRQVIQDGLAQVQMVKQAAHVKKGMATVSRFDGLAVPDGTGGLWTVPLFERWPHLMDALGAGVTSDLAAIMIDLSGFSSETADLTPSAIRTILDPFYDKVVAEVEGAGGVVEKFIGDAVIALFGHPFRDEGDMDKKTQKSELRAAVNVAKECIRWSHQRYGGKMTAKAAMAFGEMFVGWVGPETYSDLTVIGKPMTEMFRLEGVAPDQGIIMPAWLFEDNLRASTSWAKPLAHATWLHSDEDLKLRGVGDLRVHKIRYNPR